MKIKNYLIISLSAILCISVLFTCFFKFDSLPSNNINVEHIESLLNRKQEELIKTTGDICNFLNDTVKIEEFFFGKKVDDFTKSGTGFLLYENNELKYWTTNDIPVPTSSTFHFFDKNILNLNNGWYLAYPVQYENYLIVGLFQIKKEYSYENDNLSEYFWHEFNLSSNVQISTDFEQSSTEICINNDENCIYLLYGYDYEFSVSKRFILKHFLLVFNFLLLLVVILLIFIKLFKDCAKSKWLLFLLLI